MVGIIEGDAKVAILHRSMAIFRRQLNFEVKLLCITNRNPYETLPLATSAVTLDDSEQPFQHTSILTF